MGLVETNWNEVGKNAQNSFQKFPGFKRMPTEMCVGQSEYFFQTMMKFDHENWHTPGDDESRLLRFKEIESRRRRACVGDFFNQPPIFKLNPKSKGGFKSYSNTKN